MKRITCIASYAVLLLGCTLTAYAENGGESKKYLPLIISACIIAVAAIIALSLILKSKKSGKKGTVDLLTGAGNINYVREKYNETVQTQRTRYCIAYIGFDSSGAEAHFGKEKIVKLQKMSAKVILDDAGYCDYAGRISDGEFAFCLKYDGISSLNDRLNNLVERLNETEKSVLDVKTYPFRVGVCMIGIDDESFDKVLENAKLGYDIAKINCDSVFICTKETLRNEESRKRLRNKLSNAMDKKQFDVFLQFIYDVKKEKFTTAEVLSRWNNPEEGFVMPGYYIKDMVSLGLIDTFDYYMIDETCKLLEKWHKEGFNDLILSCNVTRITISSPDFAKKLSSIIKKYKFDHDRLAFEITEDFHIGDKDIARKNMDECIKTGITVALDDFGAGTSTENDIHNYPISVVKIDRHMILNAEENNDNGMIKTITDIAHERNIEVVVEGVETDNQREIALKNGCDYIQGYYYSYVYPIDEGMEYYRNSFKQ